MPSSPPRLGKVWPPAQLSLSPLLQIKFDRHRATLTLVLSVAEFMPQRQSGVAVTKAMWPTEPKIFTK